MDLPEGIACPFPSAVGTIFKGRGWVISDIVGRGDWLGKLANPKLKTTVLQFMLEVPWPCTIFFVHMRIFYFVSKFEMIGMLLNIVHRQVQES